MKLTRLNFMNCLDVLLQIWRTREGIVARLTEVLFVVLVDLLDM